MYTVNVVLSAFNFVLFCIFQFLFFSCLVMHFSALPYTVPFFLILHALRCFTVLLVYRYIFQHCPAFPHFLALSAFPAFSCVSVHFRSLPFGFRPFPFVFCALLHFPAFYHCISLFSCVLPSYSAFYAFICVFLCLPAFSCVFTHLFFKRYKPKKKKKYNKLHRYPPC